MLGLTYISNNKNMSKKENATVRIKIFPKDLKQIKIRAAKAEMTIGEFVSYLLSISKMFNASQYEKD